MEAFNKRDHELYRAYFDPEIRIRRPLADAGGSLPNRPGTYQGIDEFIELMNSIGEAHNLTVSIRNIEEGEDGLVFVELLQTFGPEDAREHQMTWVVDEIRDGRIVNTANYATEAEARIAFERGLPDF